MTSVSEVFWYSHKGITKRLTERFYARISVQKPTSPHVSLTLPVTLSFDVLETLSHCITTSTQHIHRPAEELQSNYGWIWKEHLEVTWLSPLLKQGHVEQDNAQMVLIYNWKLRLYIISGQLVLVLCHHHSEKVVPCSQRHPLVSG